MCLGKITKNISVKKKENYHLLFCCFYRYVTLRNIYNGEFINIYHCNGTFFGKLCLLLNLHYTYNF